MKVRITKAIVTDKFKSQKSGATFATLWEETEAGESSVLQFRSEYVDLTGLPSLVPLAIDAEVSGSQYKGGPVTLNIVSLSVTKL